MTSPGILYIVATPIGNLEDITLRALRILKEVQLIAAEDTRHSRKLLQHYGITTPLISLHDYNEQTRSQQLLTKLQEGQQIALISDAGTPLISDPGYVFVQRAQQLNIKVIPVPGACAGIAALSAAGLPTDKFIFEGFLPAKAAARQQRLQLLATETRTLIFYESTHRILEFMQDVLHIFGENRILVIAKELTKTFETIYADSIQAVNAWLLEDSQRQKGEFVILIKGADAQPQEITLEAQKILELLLAELPTKQAVKLTGQITQTNKNVLYDLALKLDKK